MLGSAGGFVEIGLGGRGGWGCGVIGGQFL